MAELADALDLESSAARLAGSTPVTRTRLIIIRTFIVRFFFEDYTPMQEQLNRNQDKLLKYINKFDNINMNIKIYKSYLLL